ncbi:MAG: enoyl-CoA hydratase [Xanthomonadaceae bacterium]|nr:enoyl-CoA hydratase [Xanthomonadaceae bacterium]
MSEPVLIERRDHVTWITLNREARRNALNEDVVRRIEAGIDAAGGDGISRAIVLTGAGDKAFCAGADLARDTDGSAFAAKFAQPGHYMVDLFKRLLDCRLPVVARVNGHAMAGGFGLLCACDMAVAADDIRIGTTETRIGLSPMMILPHMMRILPPRRLQEMCITGEPFSAREALDWGVLNYVVPRAELDRKLDWLLARIVDKSPTAIRLGKHAFNAMRDMDLREAMEVAQVMILGMSSTEDAREGLAAFQDKRPPVWTGR